MSDEDLYELRRYVSKPGMAQTIHDQWESDHYAIYQRYHEMLGGFDGLCREPHPETGEDADGVVLLMRHDDRAALDRATDQLVAEGLMNQVPGPPGPDVVDHWERTFLYPVVLPPEEPVGGTPAPVWEMRTFRVDDAAMDRLLESAEDWFAAFSARHRTHGLFVSHPEHRDMPDGVAVLIRHDDAAAATARDDDALAAEFGTVAGAPPASVGRQLLRPFSISPLA